MYGYQYKSVLKPSGPLGRHLSLVEVILGLHVSLSPHLDVSQGGGGGVKVHVHHRVIPQSYVCQNPFVPLGGERHCEGTAQ